VDFVSFVVTILIDVPASFNQVLGSRIENIDAFPVIDPATGKIGLRLVRDGEASAAWDADDFTDSPEVAIRWKEDRGWLNAIPAAVAPDDVEPEGEYSAQPLLATVALELPYGYLREAKASLIFLPVRGDSLTNGFHAWWERTADSFVQVAGGSSFAMKGTLNAALDGGMLADATIDIAFAGNTGPVTIPNAQLVALLGAETDFKLRAFYSLAGLRSLSFDEITVLEGES